jgi:hypothetical protein
VIKRLIKLREDFEAEQRKEKAESSPIDGNTVAIPVLPLGETMDCVSVETATATPARPEPKGESNLVQIGLNVKEERPGEIVVTIYGNEMIRSATPSERRHIDALCDHIQAALAELGLKYAPKRLENTEPHTATFTT